MLHTAVAEIKGVVTTSETDARGNTFIVVAMNRDPNKPMYFRIHAHGNIKDTLNYLCRKGDTVAVRPAIVPSQQGVFFNINNIHQIDIFPYGGIKEMQNRYHSIHQAGF